MTLGPHGTPEPERLLRVRIREPYAPFWPHPDPVFGYLHNVFAGEVHDVPEAIAREWIRENVAELVEETT